jgi:hypothetical protein
MHRLLFRFPSASFRVGSARDSLPDATPIASTSERGHNQLTLLPRSRKKIAMPDSQATKACCQRTIERMMRMIRESYVSFPVIKDVPCEECKEILAIRVYTKPE